MYTKTEIITPAQTVGQSIQGFYDENNFGEDGGIKEKYVWIKFGFFSIPIPNVESRKNNVHLHDVSHIITAYDTTWKGESAVSAWEVASGGWENLFIPWLLTLWAMGLGVLFYTKSTLNAFKRGLTMRNALTSNLSKNEIYKLTVKELREILSNKPKNNKNPVLWSSISVLVFILPFLIVFLSILGIVKLA